VEFLKGYKNKNREWKTKKKKEGIALLLNTNST